MPVWFLSLTVLVILFLLALVVALKMEKLAVPVQGNEIIPRPLLASEVVAL